MVDKILNIIALIILCPLLILVFGIATYIVFFRKIIKE